MSFAEKAQLVFAVLTLPFAAGFVWMYARDAWWKTWFGRSLMLLAVAVIMYTVSVILFRIYGIEYRGRDFMIVASSGLTFAAMVMRTMVLGRVQRAERRERRSHRF